ncbi:MAG: hypothetical protein H6631_00505 [Anaerolineaceae bacterium]|nr:hypothetical protein [Anaerolineaceae bacterium]MCB9100275.1 hypothetical protein [Anaerolineales bacterium]
MQRLLTKKWLIIGGVVGTLALVGVLAMGAIALAQGFPGRAGFGPRAFAFRGQPGDDFFFDGPREFGFFQEGPGRGHKGPHGGVAGEVTAIDGSTLTVADRDGQSITVNTTEDTPVFLVETGSEGSISDIQVSSNIGVRGQRNDDGSVEARGVTVMPAGDMAGGRVTNIDGGQITVDNPRDQTTTIITTDDKTTFRLDRDSEAGSIADVTTASAVMAFGETQSDGSLAARLVLVHEHPMKDGERGPQQGFHGGEVSAIDGAKLTVKDRNGDDITVVTDDSTEYRTRDGSDVSFKSIEVGSRIAVKGQPVEDQDNTIKADVIDIVQPKNP